MKWLFRHGPSGLVSARRLAWFTPILLSTLVGARPAVADTAVGLRAGTPGVGVELTTGLSPTLHLRVAAAAFDQSLTVETDAVRYDGDVELRHLLALLDVHPGKGSFRLSLGVAFNEDGLVATAPVLDLIGDDLPPEVPPGLDLGRLVGRAEGDAVAPYAGIGFGNPLAGEGWSFAVDLGAIYLGSPDVQLDLETAVPLGQIPGAQEAIDALVAREEAALAAEIAGYDILPVLSFSLSYKF